MFVPNYFRQFRTFLRVDRTLKVTSQLKVQIGTYDFGISKIYSQHFLVCFELPIFSIELMGDSPIGEQGLVNLSFGDFIFVYEKCHKYETNIQVKVIWHSNREFKRFRTFFIFRCLYVRY